MALTLSRICMISACLISAAAAHASWPAIYGNGANDDDVAVAIKVGVTGAVNIAGATFGNGTGRDIQIVKYDRLGNLLWATTYGATNIDEVAIDVATDGPGNVFVTGIVPGASSEDIITIKYSKTGVFQWAKTVNGAFNGDDEPIKIAVDPSGNVVVTGFVATAGGGNDIETIEYATTGATNWGHTYSSAGNHVDVPRDIAIDGSGNVFLAARVWGGAANGYDFGALEYSSAGVLVWSKKLNGIPNGYDEPAAICIDLPGDIVVTGRSEGPGAQTDFLTVKYSSTGVKQWERRTGLGGVDEAPVDMVIDPFNNIVVTGTTGNTSNSDIMTVKYDPTGSKIWAKRYVGDGTPVNSGDNPVGVEVDASGNLFVGGNYQSSANGQFYYVMMKYSPAGARLWVRIDSIGANGPNYAHATAFDAPTGRAYMTGESNNPAVGNADIYTTKY